MSHAAPPEPTRPHVHAHGGPPPDVEVLALSRRLLVGSLVAIGVAIVVGLVVLWPRGDVVGDLGADAQFAAPGVTFPHGEIVTLTADCSDGGGGPTVGACQLATVELTTSDERGERVEIQLLGPTALSGLRPGDGVQLMRVPGGEAASYSFFGVDRAGSLGWLLLLFVVAVLVVARLRGLLALIGLVVAGFVVVRFMLPGLLTGESGVAVTLVGAGAIMYVVLYLAHGVSVRTSTALAGTLVGVGLTALLAHAAVAGNRLSGIGDEAGARLSSFDADLDFRVLLTGAIIVAGLGVLNDVTITQSSAVWELRAAGPQLTRGELFASGMRIGRDHIASTIYTIVFAYVGAALSVLLVVYLFQRPALELLGTEDIGAEVASTLCSAIGLVLAVPVTTAIAALTVSGPVADLLPEEDRVSPAPAR